MEISILVSPGELIDRITILEIKQERVPCERKRQQVAEELTRLYHWLIHLRCDDITDLVLELKRTNEKLWDVENALRSFEEAKSFEREFVDLARSVYCFNDRRASLKKTINARLGVTHSEVKHYESAKAAETGD